VTVFVQRPGQTVRILLDNQSHDVAPLLSQQPAWTSNSLDPTVPHDLQVIKQNPAGQYTSLDSILVTSHDSPAVSDQSTSSADTSNETNALSAPPSFQSLSTSQPSPSALSGQQSNTEPILSGGKLAAVVVVCSIVPALFLVAGILLYRQWKRSKRKAASTAYREWMAANGPAPVRPSFTPTPFDGRFDERLPKYN
jgi:hypothetical protein